MAPTEIDKSPQLDGDPVTDSELAAAAKVKLIIDPPARAKAVLPGPTWPLDSHPDNVRAFIDKWNMDPRKNGPEVMQALESPGPSTASGSKDPSLSPVAPSAPVGAPAPAAAPAAAESKMPEAVTPPVTAATVATPVPVDTPTTVATPVPTPTAVATPVPVTPAAVATPVTETPTAVATGTLGGEASAAVPTPADALQEMEALVQAGQAANQPQAPAARQVQQQAATVNWSTHKKEGMRLTRLMDSNAATFPHMAKMWEGSKKDRKTKQIYKHTFK